MNEQERKDILKGLDEVYAKRPQTLLNESSQFETVMIGGYAVKKISGSFNDYAKSNGLINIDDVQWSR